MRFPKAAIAVGLVAVVGCGTSIPSTPASGSTPPTDASPVPSDEPTGTDPVVGMLADAWRRSPIPLDERHVAIISDACAATAREQLGADLAGLPTALVDSRGAGLATAILADDLHAVEC